MNSIRVLVAAVAVACAAPFPAQAQDGGRPIYLGAGAGWLHAGGDAINQAFADQGLAATSSDVDSHASGWKAFVGYRFGSNVAIEVAYTDLGRYDFQGQVIADPGTVQARLRADAWSTCALGIVPLSEDLAAFAKGGAAFWRSQLDASGTFSGRRAESTDANGVGPVAGLGLHWQLTPGFAARIEWERFFRVGNTASGRSDIDFASASLQYRL